MAEPLHDINLFFQNASPRLIPVDLPPQINMPVTGTLNNVPVQTVIDGAASSGGDITTDILENSGTAIVVTSSNLFTYPGTNQAGVFVGSGGIQGRNQAGDVTFSIASIDGDAEFLGLLKAGSILTDSITLAGSGRSLAIIDAGATGYTQTQLNADLTSGVANIVAGTGSDFILDVNAAGGIVSFRHKDAVYNGTAAPGSNKPALAITANGIAMGYNQSSDGAWVDSVALSSLGNLSVLGNITAGSVISTGATISGTLLTFQDVVDKVNEAPGGGDNTVSVLENSGTEIVITSSNLFKTTTGLGGVFIGGGGLFGKNTSGTTTFSIDGATGTPTFSGTIFGGSNINITGSASFRGATSSSNGTASGVFNSSFTQANGAIGYGSASLTGSGMVGISGGGSTSQGLLGIGLSAVDTGVTATASAGGVALKVVGRMTINTTTKVNNLHAARATVADSVTGSVAFATTAGTANSVSASNITGNIDADSLAGRSSTAYSRRSLCNSNGYTTVSGGDTGIRTTGTLFTNGVRTRASGNTVFIEDTSSALLKTNIQDEALGLDFINTLRPITCEFKDNPGYTAHSFVAEEVDALVAEKDGLTGMNEDGDMGVGRIGLIGPMVNAIKQLKVKIESLETEIELLKGK